MITITIAELPAGGNRIISPIDENPLYDSKQDAYYSALENTLRTALNTYIDQVNTTGEEINATQGEINQIKLDADSINIQITDKINQVNAFPLTGSYTQEYIEENFVLSGKTQQLQNESFSSGAIWTKEGNATISGGQAVLSIGSVSQNVVIDKRKYFEIDVQSLTGSATLAVSIDNTVIETISTAGITKIYSTETSGSTIKLENTQGIATINSAKMYDLPLATNDILLTTGNGDALPTADPLMAGVHWNNSGVEQISQG